MTERNAINLIFLIAGISFASWAGRLSVINTVFAFSGQELGYFLLCMTLGTLLGISLIPFVSSRISTRLLLLIFPLALAACLVGLGIAVSLTNNPWLAFAILFVNGIFFGSMDVMMNVSGAQVEQRLKHSIMPIFHGFFSLGSLLGAGIATVTLTLKVSTFWHFMLVAGLIIGLAIIAQRGMSSWIQQAATQQKSETTHSLHRNKLGLLLLLGVMVGGLSFAEGAANDWIAVATVDGHGLLHRMGALMFTCFVAAMTLGRFAGGKVVDRLGPLRTLMLMGTIGLAGICLFILGQAPVVLALGASMWGLGSSLGFPIGMSLAASGSVELGPRAVSILSAFGYGSMLTGPPLIGFAVDQLGLPQALWIAAAVMALSLLLTPLISRTRLSAQRVS
ncbi:MFS transporter [Glutamicibacter sp. NPDC087344]|uniref:MFS transporter n=1 Tax=Glutamicibacter sp. NPDC087344 TaxID=3363994 RepID=UPI00382EC04B